MFVGGQFRRGEWRTKEKFCIECKTKLRLRNNRDLVRKHYCSVVCRAHGTARTKNRFILNRERPCTECGELFLAKFARQIYCCKKCQQRAATARYEAKQEPLSLHLRRLLIYQGRSSLSLEFLLRLFSEQDGRCALSGIKMTWGSGYGRIKTHVSIDKIDPSGHYEHNNVQLVCRIVNSMKLDMSLDELLSWCESIMEVRNAKRLKEAA